MLQVVLAGAIVMLRVGIQDKYLFRVGHVRWKLEKMKRLKMARVRFKWGLGFYKKNRVGNRDHSLLEFFDIFFYLAHKEISFFHFSQRKSI